MLMQLTETVKAHGVQIGPRAMLVLWNDCGAGSTIWPTLNGALLPRPFATLSLDTPLKQGGAASGCCATLLRLPRTTRPGDGVISLRPGVSLPLSAVADSFEALKALPLPARTRLLCFLLEFGRGPLGLSAEPALVQLCEALATPADTLKLEATLGDRLILLLGNRVAPGTTAYLMGSGGVTRVRLAPTPAGLLLLDPPYKEAHTLLLAGPAGLLRWVLDPAPALSALAAMAACSVLRRRLPEMLAPLSGVPVIAALLRECVLLPAVPARRQRGAALDAVLELAFTDGAGGAFLKGWTRDPLTLVQGASVLAGSAEIPLPPGSLFHFDPVLSGRDKRDSPQPGARGFVTYLPQGCPPGIGPSLRLRLGSGAALNLTADTALLTPAAARDVVLGAVPLPEASAVMLDRCLRPAAARLHAAAVRGRPAPTLVRIGTPVSRPAVSIIVALYRNLGFQRFQMAAIAADPGMKSAELIFVLDSPEQRAETEHLLRGLHAMHGVPMLLVVMPSNMGYGPANNDAATHARGRYLLLLNSDVVPAAPGWLAHLMAPLEADRAVGAAGPKLLFEDGSVQHAGLFFERDACDGIWLNRHFSKGYPRQHRSASRARLVPGVTGAAVLVRRKLFEKVGGFTEDYIVGDYEDSDLCLKLRRTGAEIAYAPAAELFHFERRSIRLHPGYNRTLASSCNRRLHHETWDRSISALMRRKWR